MKVVNFRAIKRLPIFGTLGYESYDIELIGLPFWQRLLPQYDGLFVLP